MTEYRLGDICKVINGRAYRQPELLDAGKYPVLRVGNFFSSDRWFYSDLELPEDKYCDNGDLLFAWSASFGPRIWDGGKVIYHYHIWKLEANETIVDKYYLYYWLRKSVDILTAGTHGSVMAHMTKGDMENQRILLPCIEEQRKVGRTLRLLDDKIKVNSKINDNLEQQAATLITRYQTTTDAATTLSDIMDFENGFAFQSSTYLAEGAYRIITIKNVQDGRIDSDGAAYIDSLPPRMKSGCKLNIGDSLISLTGNVGRVGIVCENNLLLNQRVAKITPHDSALLPFLYFVFRLSNTKTMLESIAKGTAQLNLSPIETLKLSIPFEKETAMQLSRDLAPIYQAIVVNNQENIALAHVRDSLLPKLMSGEIDVSDIRL